MNLKVNTSVDESKQCQVVIWNPSLAWGIRSRRMNRVLSETGTRHALWFPGPRDQEICVCRVSCGKELKIRQRVLPENTKNEWCLPHFSSNGRRLSVVIPDGPPAAPRRTTLEIFGEHVPILNEQTNRLGKGARGTGRKFQIGNVSLYIVQGLFVSVYVDDIKLAKKIRCGNYSTEKLIWENQHLSWIMYTWDALKENAK